MQFLHDRFLDVEAGGQHRVNDVKHCRHAGADTPLHGDFDDKFNPNLNSEAASVLKAEPVSRYSQLYPAELRPFRRSSLAIRHVILNGCSEIARLRACHAVLA